MDEEISYAGDLLPCPFCGRAAVMICRGHSEPTHLARCPGKILEPCVEGRQFGYPEGGAKAQMQRAAEWWNTRA